VDADLIFFELLLRGAHSTTTSRFALFAEIVEHAIERGHGTQQGRTI
jgi:hypothetical protein